MMTEIDTDHETDPVQIKLRRIAVIDTELSKEISILLLSKRLN